MKGMYMQEMGVNKDYELEKIHELELRIACEIKRICEKNNIRYFLTAGTLLGAVRHAGFIPWDDDMDIGMLREDFIRFEEVCKTQLGEEFFLQTWDSDSDYPYSFAKVRLNGTHIEEAFSQEGHSHDGLFVDIFPFDNAPDDEKLRKKHARQYFFYKRLLWVKKGYGTNMKSESFRQLVRFYLFKLISLFFSYERGKAKFYKIQTKYNNIPTKKVVTDGSYKYNKECIERKWVENLGPVKFEDVEFLSYNEKEEYLTYFYGDYMKLPPEDKRNRHQRGSVDFGKYA